MKLDDKKISDLTLEDKKIIILTYLKERNALITPVVTHEFNDFVIDKIITAEDYHVCWTSLTKDKLIRTESSPHYKSIFATWITPEGIEAIEKHDKKITEEQITKLQLENLKITNRKLKNEWWRNPLIAVLSLAVGIIGTLTTQYLSPRLIPKNKSENIYEETVKLIIRSMQKDNVKKKP